MHSKSPLYTGIAQIITNFAHGSQRAVFTVYQISWLLMTWRYQAETQTEKKGIPMTIFVYGNRDGGSILVSNAAILDGCKIEE